MRRELTLAHDLDEVKDIRDKAEALRMYAKQAKLGLHDQNRMAEIKLRAERRAGELLAETVRHRGGLPSNESYDGTHLPEGISRNQSSRWQQVATIPENQFEDHIRRTTKAEGELTSAGLLRLGRRLRRNTEREALTKDIGTIPPDERYRLIHADIRDAIIEPESVDIILTDPPYPREYLDLYTILSKQASLWLKPGGSVLAMCGQSYLPDVLTALGQHLTYHWTVSYLTPGGQSAQLWQRKVNTFWKPVVWYVKGKYDGNWVGDVARGDVNDNDKRFHDWGQSESGMADLIRRFTQPGWTICDPFCGGGTIGVAALRTDRFYIGIDNDPNSILTTRSRLANVSTG